MIRLVCLLALLLPLTSQAQFTYTLDTSIPVQDLEGNNLPLAWSGGLNAAQFNTMDLNGDGTDDLVLYDRMANKVITLLASDNQYVHAPDYENMFPSEIYSWLLLRDYDCDGRKDIFTGHTLGIKVFKNVSSGGVLAWEQHIFSTGNPNPEANVLMTKGSTTFVNLQLQPDDLPAISDIDGDGDLDILNIQYMGHTVEYHRNLTMENYQSCDSLEFVRVTRSWGGVQECDCGIFGFNNAPCPPNSGGRTKHAGGKSLLAIDINGDNQQDLLFSEAECTQLYALTNEGTADNPAINNFFAFPQSGPINFVLFPAAFYEDVDFDGKKDLISTPNIFAKEFLNTDLRNSTWYYKNTGSNENPAFTFSQQNFLQGSMIDVGDNAVPAFVDHDGDGDLDMLVSTHSSDEFTSRVYLFTNTGSAESPSFKMTSEDYLGFTRSRYYNLKIQVTDMDGNQTPDLVFTATNFDNGATNLYYLPNSSSTSLNFGGADLRQLSFALTNSENVYVADVSGDGLPDLFVGRSEGNLEYWKNNGVAGSPQFAMEEENFLGFASSTLRQNPMVAIGDLDGDGRSDLVIGDQTGKPGIISDFQNATSGEGEIIHNLVFNNALEKYDAKNLGGKLWPVVVNLFNTDKPALVLGNGLGGVHLLKHDDGASLSERPELHIYPNPVAKQGILNVRADRQGVMEVYSVLGQRLSTPVVLKAHETYRYELPPLAAGLYLLKFTANKKSRAQRFVIE